MPHTHGWASRPLLRKLARRSSTLSLCCAVALGGCASVPKLGPRPEVVKVETLATSRTFAGPETPWPADQWWHDFRDPQLDRLMDEALAGSPTIEQAAGRIRVAAAQADLARATLLPSAGLTATARYSRITQSIGLPTDGDWHLLGAGLINASYSIDLWGKNRSALRAAVSEQRAGEADAAAARLALTTSVASAYTDLSQLFLRRSVAADALKVRQATLDLVTRRFNAGIDPRTAMEQARAGADAATGALAAIDEAIGLNRNAIAALLGAGPDRGLDIQAPQLVQRRPPGLPADAAIGLVGRKPEIVSARWRVEAEAQRIGVAHAGFYPNVSVAGLIGLASFGLSNLFKDESVIGSVGPAISLPIFDGGRLRANYRGARARYDVAVGQYDEALLRALHDAADAATSQRALAARQQSADNAVARQESAYRLSRMRYEGGLSDYQSVLIVENSLLDARDQAASLRLRGYVLDISLVDALGGGFRGDLPTTKTTPADGAVR
jgi:NodT family efflux transporter outer membrane factor (OMF) lipoprotein